MTRDAATAPTSPTALVGDERAGGIYRTAARIIYAKGFEATSMSEIAKAVDLTKAGLYYYVKGKGELLYAIMSFAMDLLDREVIRPAERIDDPGERLRAIVKEHARLMTHDEGALVILMDEVASLSPEQRSRITERKRRYFEFVRGTLDELAAAGRLHVIDTTVAALSLLGMMLWLARWYVPGGRLTAREVVRDITEIALSGVLREGRPEGRPAASSASLDCSTAVMSLGPSEDNTAPESTEDDEIGRLYDLIAELAAEDNAEDPELDHKLDDAWTRLRQLQAEEADRFYAAFEASLKMPIDAGKRLRDEANALRQKLENLTSTDPSAEETVRS